MDGEHLDSLVELWKDYDPRATGFITYKDFVFLVYELPPPLGIKRSDFFTKIREKEEEENEVTVKPQ